MASFNSVVLLGNLTRDPELRYTPQGTAVTTFGLAVNRRYRQGEDQREEVLFVDIVAFGRQAETVSEYLSKGNLAMVEGRLHWRSWESEDGQKRSKHEVVANNVQFMPRSGGSGDPLATERRSMGQERPSGPPAALPSPFPSDREDTFASMDDQLGGPPDDDLPF